MPLIVYMAYRTFCDSNGSYWQVWDVRPDRVERRSLERRTIPPPLWRGLERRKGERRGLSGKRTVVNEGNSTGWLIFESLTAKRRLAPIPVGWEKCSQAELRVLAEKAVPLKGSNGHTGVA
jgi:hypothetical protein